MNVLLYPHGGSGNHGCEAIVRSTLKITGANAILYSNAVEEDEKYQLNKLCTLKDAQQPISRNSVLYWKALFQNKVLGVKDAYDVVACSGKAVARCVYDGSLRNGYGVLGSKGKSRYGDVQKVVL